jgi:glycogen debranching enzyme
MSVFTSEWLVADQRGAFAMGTRDGVRTRKYHGFFMGIPGRSESAFLVDFDMECDGNLIWPHRYKGPEGSVFYPDLESSKMKFQSEVIDGNPHWKWSTREGKLKFIIESGNPGGIHLSWKWFSKTQKSTHLKIRGLWAMRDLHALGGNPWEWRSSQNGGHGRFDVVSADGRKVHLLLKGNWQWTEDPQWYRGFHYSEELNRGYPADEDVYSAGYLEIELGNGETVEWILAEDANDLNEQNFVHRKSKSKTSDFILTRPAGIVAGFPWFGEWGRDTFVSLPGIVGESLRVGTDPDHVWSWARELLLRWGTWIDKNGMLPNILEKNGQCQWQSADATLWWCHSLAALWTYSLSPPFPFLGIEREFIVLLKQAIDSIRNGQHSFLRETRDQVLEVTEPHATWMDARVNGVAVTPRLGRLPEINALWFEACCLHSLWSESTNFSELEALGKAVLRCREPSRPNTVFLHSLSLSPSFVLKDWDSLEQDLMEIAEGFWTPLGLKTLLPSSLGFRPRCVGDQQQRDLSYHQGPAWGWLGGHFEMARHRLISYRAQDRFDHSSFDKMFVPALLKEMPIEGHIPEIFDAEQPYAPRGAPAQAWSLACLEEAKARRRLKTDSKISRILAQRWLGRRERKDKSRGPGREAGILR